MNTYFIVHFYVHITDSYVYELKTVDVPSFDTIRADKINIVFNSKWLTSSMYSL